MINAEMIGKNIRHLRKERHISQGKMAEDLGMYQADISNLERAMGGSGISDIYKLDLIADYFGVPLDKLISVSMQEKEETTVQEKEEAPAQAPAEAHENAPKKHIEPEADELFDVDYTDLAAVYRFRLIVETSLKNPHVYDDIFNLRKEMRAILKKLKAACESEEGYKVWKKDLIDAKVREVMEKQHIVVCTYLFAGVGQYEEIMPIEMVDSFKCWIDHNGSAFFGGTQEANKRQIRTFVSMHIADELLGIDSPMV